ncbi:hypothetical protein ACQEVM_15865 [Streptomyces sp. CA-243310]|uniref:hypothetical protein n=1 Tax=Streptomyces sp. CA-243310 TaxID=3240056 RepID=UPI003D949B02
MKVLLTRASVSMGDDTDAPHERRHTFPAAATIGEAITSVLAGGYLPHISGGLATWILTTAAGEPLAVVAQQWAAPRLLPAGRGNLVSLTSAPHDDALAWHFRYRAQEDPEAVHAGLGGPGTPRSV